MAEPNVTTAPDVLPCVHVKIGRSSGRIMLGGPVYRIRGERGKDFTFEWHPYFGPSRCSSTTGDILGDGFFATNSLFWPLFQRWMNGGKKVDEFGRCILGPPIPPCDEACPDCHGTGWYRIEGERTKYRCLGETHRIALKPLGSDPLPEVP